MYVHVGDNFNVEVLLPNVVVLNYYDISSEVSFSVFRRIFETFHTFRTILQQLEFRIKIKFRFICFLSRCKVFQESSQQNQNQLSSGQFPLFQKLLIPRELPIWQILDSRMFREIFSQRNQRRRVAWNVRSLEFQEKLILHNDKPLQLNDSSAQRSESK